ncbi:NAD(P)/FAD-dependent oxidoreductase [Cryptosporangium phraense]|uniref:NAD(P)/FAD-dependent oxidoreductase n=1 Tax=Cryptosporangium phraense TaxID=2593070 RepID=A0A545AG36_9ACTN|nr:NAD(P)/FAD-dependent oxidoreductase [Cryptosporangium phraense]TQS39595.1 NAD(P)/FAD-dependent oxidoreductase [Cryptosporangium phraense]
MRDLLVVGGGPAGLVTALLAARRGLSAVVLEPRRGPIDKACGEGLMPGAAALLAELGVEVPGLPFRGIHYADATRSVDALFRTGPGRGVRRTALHTALSDAVARAGIEVVPVAAGEVTQDADSVSAGGVRARYLAAADGLHSPIRRRLGLQRPSRGPARHGLRRHYATAPWSDLVEVHWARGAEAYVTPVAPDLVGVAILTADRGPFEGQLARFPALAERLRAGARAAGPAGADAGGAGAGVGGAGAGVGGGRGAVRGAGPLHQRVSARVAGRVLLVGDAAGYIDALTGEGLAVAWASAAELVDCVARNAPAEYERRWRRASRRYRVLTGGLLAARNQPLVARAIVPAAARLPRVFAAVVNQLAR